MAVDPIILRVSPKDLGIGAEAGLDAPMAFDERGDIHHRIADDRFFVTGESVQTRRDSESDQERIPTPPRSPTSQSLQDRRDQGYDGHGAQPQHQRRRCQQPEDQEVHGVTMGRDVRPA